MRNPMFNPIPAAVQRQIMQPILALHPAVAALAHIDRVAKRWRLPHVAAFTDFPLKKVI
jgi:hypothetical protein